MTRTFLALALVAAVLAVAPASSQTAQQADRYNGLLERYLTIRPSYSSEQQAEVDALFGDLRADLGLERTSVLTPLEPRRPVGRLSTNPYLPQSTASPSASYDSRSPANPYGRYGSPYAPDGAGNPYATGGLEVYGEDGTYLGRLNSNPYDPESVANPYGRYGSPYSSESVNNPYGRFGSPYSPSSANNPYATSPPPLYAPDSGLPSLPSLPPLWPPDGG